MPTAKASVPRDLATGTGTADRGTETRPRRSVWREYFAHDIRVIRLPATARPAR